MYRLLEHLENLHCACTTCLYFLIQRTNRDCRVGRVGFVVYQVALGFFFFFFFFLLQVLQFIPVIIIPPMVHNFIHLP